MSGKDVTVKEVLEFLDTENTFRLLHDGNWTVGPITEDEACANAQHLSTLTSVVRGANRQAAEKRVIEAAVEFVEKNVPRHTGIWVNLEDAVDALQSLGADHE